jgi:hypothetical protein
MATGLPVEGVWTNVFLNLSSVMLPSRADATLYLLLLITHTNAFVAPVFELKQITLVKQKTCCCRAAATPTADIVAPLPPRPPTPANLCRLDDVLGVDAALLAQTQELELEGAVLKRSPADFAVVELPLDAELGADCFTPADPSR